MGGIVGDGVNDATAITPADFGFASGLAPMWC